MYFFCLKLNSLHKMYFFEVYHVDVEQRLQNLKFLLISSDFSLDISFLLIVLISVSEKIGKRLK